LGQGYTKREINWWILCERYISPFEIATVYADLEETDLALEWFEKALDERSSWMVFLKTTPKFERLRSAPGYAALLDALDLREVFSLESKL
jgi:hypothetical protein